MESQVEVRPLRVVVVLHEAQKAGPRVEVVFDAASGEQGGEAAAGQPGGGAGQVGPHNDVSASAPRALQFHVRTAAAVERAPVHERAEREGPTRGHEVLQLVAGPPVTAGWDLHRLKDVERVDGRVQEALHVHLEAVSVLPVAAEEAPLEPCGLPVPRAATGRTET